MKEMGSINPSKRETEEIFKQYRAEPNWTPEKLKKHMGYEPDGASNGWNVLTRTGELRGKYKGLSDDQIFVTESARLNASQAKLLLWQNEGSKTDKQRWGVLNALHDLASVATLPLVVPSAASTPFVGTSLSTKVGSGAPLVSAATEGKMMTSNNALMAKLMNYHSEGKVVTVMVNGRPVQVHPGLPFSGFSNTRRGGWTLGDEAFSSMTELRATMRHELYRVRNTQIPFNGVSAERAAAETSAAFQFSK